MVIKAAIFHDDRHLSLYGYELYCLTIDEVLETLDDPLVYGFIS